MTAALVAVLLAAGARAQTTPEPAPSVAYVTPLIPSAGSYNDGAGVAVDKNGNAYIAVNVYSNPFSIQVFKLSSQGAILWSSSVDASGSGYGLANGIAVCPGGDVYVAVTDRDDFSRIFRLDARQGGLVSSVIVPSGPSPSYTPDLTGIACDPASGHIYAVETTNPAGSPDSVVALEYDAALSGLLASQSVTATSGPNGSFGTAYFSAGMAVDGPGNVYATVTLYTRTNSYDVLFTYPPHLGSVSLTQLGYNQAQANGVGAGSAGGAYSVGYNEIYGTPNVDEGFIAGPTYNVTLQSGGDYDEFWAVAADGSSNAYVFDLSALPPSNSSQGSVRKYGPQGDLRWKLPLDVIDTEYPNNAMAADANGNVYLTGANSAGNAVVVKLSQQATPQNSISISTGDQQIGVVGSSVAVPLTALVQNASSAPVANVAVNFSISAAPVGAVGQSVSATSAMTAPHGLTSTVLTLGNVPADYYVSATVVGIASTVTFHACGKLPNANFQQGGGAPWASDPYDNTCSSQTAPGQTRQFTCPSGALPSGTSRVQIHTDGCALSALATVNNFYQASNPAIPATDPLLLNATLSGPTVNAYSGAGRIDFDRAIRGASAGAIHYVFSGGGDISAANTEQSLTQTASGDLSSASPHPVILHVKHVWPNGKVTDHYITAVGMCNGQYIVSDPAGVLSRYDPSNPGIFPFSGIRRFSP